MCTIDERGIDCLAMRGVGAFALGLSLTLGGVHCSLDGLSGGATDAGADVVTNDSGAIADAREPEEASAGDVASDAGAMPDVLRPRDGGSPILPDGAYDCSVHADDKLLWCRNTANADMHQDPMNASPVINHLRTTFSWFGCWGVGDLHAGGNTTWYRTEGDDNTSYGWVAAFDLSTDSTFDANPSAYGLAKCP
jgi:hypothetical protein